MPPPPPKKPAGSAPQAKKGRKKWSKGKTKDKANNAVVLDKPTYDRVCKEIGTYKMITVSTLIDRLKINGSLARQVMYAFKNDGVIKEIINHSGQKVYTRATGTD